MSEPATDADSSTSDALLVLYRDGKPHQNWILDQDEITIGRWEDNDVVIPDRWVSRYHARIRREGRQYIIEDLDSKNGSFVNRKRLTQPMALEDGDRIQIAPRYVLTFVDAEATAPLAQGRPVVIIDESSRRVWIGGQELTPPLSSAQYALLQTLLAQPGHVFTREELRVAVWPDEDPAGVSDEALNSLIRRLRKRLMSLDPSHRYILAVRGHGFKFEQPTPENQ
jgi:DNA-binding response OmpR family regulator